MSEKTLAEKYGETLSLEDFYNFAKSIGLKYVMAATTYDEEGTECKLSFKKTNKKLMELKKKWKSK